MTAVAVRPHQPPRLGRAHGPTATTAGSWPDRGTTLGAFAVREWGLTAPLLEVDLACVAANVGTILRTTSRSGAEVMAVVKADGFGHGAVEVSRTALAGGASWLGVTSLTEALELRAAGIEAPILSWLNAIEADVTPAVRAGVDLAVPSLEHLRAVVAAVRRTRRRSSGVAAARVHLHLDTGMSRDGAAPADWLTLCREAGRAEDAGHVVVAGVMSHLGCADEPGDPHNDAAKRRFAWGVALAESIGLRPSHRHLAATAATLNDRSTHHTMVRVGAGLVGIDPSRSTTLRSAMTLTAPLVAVRQVDRGDRVGYGHSWVAPRPTWLGLVPLGYADGLPRVSSGRAEVLVGGRRRPLVGRVSMDQVVVDLGPDRDAAARPGATVTVFGPGEHAEPTLAHWARWSDTIEHEIVTGIGRRVRRVHHAASSVDDGDDNGRAAATHGGGHR